MTKYLMCIYWGHICIFIPNIKFLSWILWLGGLCTDANDTDDVNADDADDTDNYARRTNHDYIGSFGRIPNEPIKPARSHETSLYHYMITITHY